MIPELLWVCVHDDAEKDVIDDLEVQPNRRCTLYGFLVIEKVIYTPNEVGRRRQGPEEVGR